MKKIMIFALTLGLTIGAMAQRPQKDASALTTQKARVHATMTKDATIYPASFSDCATIDSATVVSAGSIYKVVSGTNSYGDKGFAQRYSLSAPVTVKGIAAMLAKYDFTTNGTTFNVTLNNASEDDGIGTTLETVNLSSQDLDALINGNELGFTLQTYTLPSTHSLSNFAVAFNTPVFSYVVNIDSTTTPGTNDTTFTVTTDLGFVATTPANCASGSMSYTNSIADAQGNYGWVTVAESWTNLDLDMMIFPIVEGSGLNSVDINTLSYIFPNPASDNVTIASSLKMNKVEIFNMVGQNVYSSEVSGISTNVNTANLAKGTYAVKIYTANGVANKKLVVE